MTKKLQFTGLAALALLLPAGGSMAAGYTKLGTGGNLLTNAFQTTVVDSSLKPVSLTEIDGTFSTSSATSTAGLPDLFSFMVTGLTPFSATTVGTAGTVFDTQLFLFDSLGRGIYFNDDDPSQVLPGGVQLGAGATLPPEFLPIGQYFLGIATEGNAPQTAAGSNMFPYPLTDGSSYTSVDGPLVPGATLGKWSTTSDDVETGSYQILLTGAAPLSVVPEASPVALLGLGGLALAVTLRRRRSSSQV